MKSIIDAMFEDLMNDILKSAAHPCARKTHDDKNEIEYLRSKVNSLCQRVKALEDKSTPEDSWVKINVDNNDVVTEDSASPEVAEEKSARRSNAINFGAEDISLRNVCVNKIRIDIGEDRYLNMDLDTARMLYHALSVGLRKQKKAEKDNANEE